MRYAIGWILAAGLISAGAAAFQDHAPQAKLVFPSKSGAVTFDHHAHSNRFKNDCAVCHDALWPRSAAVAFKSDNTCKACHIAAGRAFEMTGNCKRCHAEA